MTVEIRECDEKSGISVIDHIEGRRFSLSIQPAVTLEMGSENRFRAPIDDAVSCQVEELELPYVVAVLVRDASGEMVAECHDFAWEELPDAEYEIEIAAPIKLYLRVSGQVTIRSSSDTMYLSFGEVTSVDLAARSYHDQPAATVTTTAAPEDLMAAISTFGSALKTTSPERSFPSLRGHPPAIELGESLSIPEAVAPPETGLQIEVPPTRSAVYSVATLAHYLGARVVPGETARLLADDTTVRSLEGPDGLQGAVTETLQQMFLLDCVVRTVGRYPLDLHERRELTERVDIPLRDLYDAPISERVTRYLDIPSESVLDLVPTWYLSTHLSPAPASTEFLPYAANALSTISVEQREPIDPHPISPPGYEEFVRSTISPTDTANSSPELSYVRVSATDTLERAWFGEGRSVNANDLHLGGVRNRFDSQATGDPINIGVVCNDDQMGAEVGDGDLYGDREELPFTVTVHRSLARDDLRALLATDLDFLHYIGHVEHGGFVCRDGVLNASDLATVGVDTFFLNGCRSYNQGLALIEGGSIGGIVTHGAVDNTNATAIGQLVAGLLNAGYSLRSALTVVGHRYTVEGRYTVIGDGGVQVAQSENGTPNLLRVVRPPDDEGYELRIATYPTLGPAMGACYTPYVPSVDQHFLVGGELPPIRLSLPEIVNLLSLERVPAIVDDEFHWSTDVTSADLP
ncbi:hypothetical protein ACFQO4_19405 [Saliphagus sp. GCM10025334]|uniref:hypothetical protein n=1 Tax=Natronosalvus caseinilyticus TaxID=2953747 RepID=UPI0028AB0961|nr:hypothetical protein [Natronosalvus caseinilyticus]